jgi:PAS domain S-box-containing protein
MDGIKKIVSRGFDRRSLRQATWLVFALWTVAVAASLLWNRRLLHEAMLDAAVTQARSDFDKDVVYRDWATMHGGVYVPVSAATPPNPYLTNIVERDLVTPSGRRLTLVNPAYMTRQVHELEAAQKSGTHGHITSLKPLRAENAPDAWEATALRAFEQGRNEVSSREVLQGEPHLRLMKPLVAKAGCLACHATQGYQVGDVRGGISVAVSLVPYLALAQARMGHVAGAHAGLWFLGVLGIFLGARQMRQRLDQQLRAEQEVQHQATFARFNPNPVLEFSAAGEISYFNNAAGEMARALGREHPAQMLPPDIEAIVRECLTTGKARLRVELPIGSRLISWSFFPVAPTNSVHGYAGDVTGRKQTEDTLRQLSRAVEQSPASIVITDPAGKIEYANPKCIEITGYTLAEMLGKNPSILKSGEKSQVAYQELWQIITAGREWRGEFHNRKKNGELYWESASISPIRDPAGQVTHYVAVKEDITARKQTEAERERLIAELREALANVKSLSGLLPICASCKKIRDDQGYWSQVESYIQKHSEAKFTHGMCPDCIKKFYADMEKDGLGDSPRENT